MARAGVPGPPGTSAPRRAAAAPRELWIAIALLAVAGCVLLYDTVPLLPDVIDFTFSSSPFTSLGVLYVVYLLELSSLGVVLLFLAHGLYRGHPRTRLVAAVLCGALGVNYLFEEHRAGTENSVMALALVVAAILALAPATRAWFGTRVDQYQRAPITAARSISGMMGLAVGFIGLSMLAVTSVDRVFTLLGAGLCVAAVLILRCLGGVRAGDVGARALLSGVMLGAVVLLVLARSEAPAAEALFVPVVVAGAVVALLWVPPSSQIHFRLAPVGASAPSPPAPAPPIDVAPDKPADIPLPAPAPAPVAPPTRAPSVVHVAVGIVPGSRMAKSSALGLVYDQESWFPEPTPDERVIGAYLVLMMLHGEGGPRDRVFEGTSTLLITDRRLAGVCPKGTGRVGALDSTRGPVVPWAVPLETLSEATTTTSRSGTYLSMRLTDRDSRLLLAKPRIVRDGGFAPVDIMQLARDLKRSRQRGVSVMSLAREGSRSP